jgi:nucleoside-specific outer membrane channel protein Tsx
MQAQQTLSVENGCRAGLITLAVAAALALSTSPARAADWSDTSIGWRYGTEFGEPYVYNGPITKNILDLQHVDGYKYGTNFFNVDLLMSDSKDPDATGGGAQEAYIVYRNTVELSKVTGGNYSWGYIRDYGVTAGYDWNTKNDAGYQSKKRMWSLGPSMMFDVPGFFKVSVLELWESNEPVGLSSRYDYKAHPELDFAWGIGIGDLPLNFQGYADWIAAKGTNEFGGPTSVETHFDGALMLDVGRVMGGPKATFKVGFEYEWWKNKFGNSYQGAAGSGALAKTPMIRAEYHF